MEVRKVQLTGKSTFVVSLPKDWARRVQLKPGDSMVVTELRDGALRISPPSLRPELRQPQSSIIMVQEDMKPETLSRLIISSYLTGYDFIRITATKGPLIKEEHRRAVRATVHELIGLEIIEQTAGEIVIQCLLDYSKLSISNVIEKMHKIVGSMQNDAITALLKGDQALANDVISRDDEVDRLYLLAVKQLKDMVRREEIARLMGMSPRACLGNRVIVKCIERIADHSERIARNVISLGKIDLPVSMRQAISEMNKTAYEAQNHAITALSTIDGNMAEEAINLIKLVEKAEDNLLKELLKQRMDAFRIICLRAVIDSLRRIADYGTDIAEIVLNLAAGEPM